jgi:Skp family chaperone for outer membrane proteins
MRWLVPLAAVGLILPQDRPKVGVVKLSRCLDKNESERVRDLEADKTKLLASYADTLARLERELDKLREAAEGVRNSPDLYRDYLLRLRLKRNEIEVWKQAGQQNLLEDAGEMHQQAVAEIRRVAARYGRDRGYDLVFLDTDLVHSAEGYDITTDALKELNEEYRKEKAARQKK